MTSATTVQTLLRQSIAEERFRATLSVVFGGAALILAAIGMYGVVSRSVADRRREIGIRVAIGARPQDVRWLIVRSASTIVAVGLLVGFPAAFATSHVARSLLFGVTPTSPHSLALACAVLTAAALGAALVPAYRAGRTDPIVALRE